MKKKVFVIGSGYSGLSCAAFLAKSGMDVTIVEKNKDIGGRSRNFKSMGYVFDMGPSWYWMPEIFENFFNNFNYSTDDFYKLIQLDPGFKIIFDKEEISIPKNWDEICLLFEQFEKNGASKLSRFMEKAEEKYNIGLKFLYESPGISFTELLNKNILLKIHKLQLLSSYSNEVKKYFSNPLLIKILEFPVIFLGSDASNMPALYTLMAYSGIKQGTFYPVGGFHKIIQAMQKICCNYNVKFLKDEEVTKLNIVNRKVDSLTTKKGKYKCDYVVGSADYAHIENSLLEKKYRNYSKKYWQKRTFSPSALVFYIGLNKKIDLEHHTLFFNQDIDQHTKELYEKKIWPTNPLFYVCCPSKTDLSVAPKGHENIFILIPVTAGLEDSEKMRNKYFNIVISEIEKYLNENISKNIDFKKSYCINDFVNDYNAYKGNAYGLANTVLQTANLKPSILNKKIDNLFYTGQLTVPGPGVPPAIISGQIVAQHIIKKIENERNI